MVVSSHELPLRQLAPPARWPSEDPFTLGVAAGEPTEHGALLWTRLAPSGHGARGATPPRPETLRWEVASDDGFRRIVARGCAVALPAHGYSVHARVACLAPSGIYWFRFRCGRFVSPSGVLRTLPSARCHVESVQLGVSTLRDCGAVAGAADLARDDLELVVLTQPGPMAAEPTTGQLQALRRRHAEALLNPELQLLRRRLMTLPVWTALEAGPPRRWSASAQAFWEHNAISPAALLEGARFMWGRLAQLQLGALGPPAAHKSAAWTMRVDEERVGLISRHGGLLRSDEGPGEARTHLAARALCDERGSYLRCELTRTWARWERVAARAESP